MILKKNFSTILASLSILVGGIPAAHSESVKEKILSTIEPARGTALEVVDIANSTSDAVSGAVKDATMPVITPAIRDAQLFYYNALLLDLDFSESLRAADAAKGSRLRAAGATFLAFSPMTIKAIASLRSAYRASNQIKPTLDISDEVGARKRTRSPRSGWAAGAVGNIVVIGVLAWFGYESTQGLWLSDSEFAELKKNVLLEIQALERIAP